MRKSFWYFSLVWLILFALFNTVSFLFGGWDAAWKYTTSFWIGYGFISLSFLIQLLCTLLALRSKDNQATFYRLSVAVVGYTGLGLSFGTGTLCMRFALPYWVAVLLCAFVLAGNLLALVKAGAAVHLVSATDRAVKQQTYFVKAVTLDAQTLMAGAPDGAMKAECKRVWEALRYSDPMSKPELSVCESAIAAKFSEFSSAVRAGEEPKSAALAKELLVLIGDRNEKCKLLK